MQIRIVIIIKLCSVNCNLCNIVQCISFNLILVMFFHARKTFQNDVIL